MDNQLKTKYIYAFTFGDGCIERRNATSRLRIEHVWRNLDYLQWKQTILQQITTCSLTRKQREGRNDTGLLLTARHPIYTTVYEQMYNQGHKVISPHFEAFLDWETMAIIFQDDGYLGRHQDYKHSIHLCTECFSYGEQLMFRNWCAEKLNMHFNINHHLSSYRLRLGKKFLDEFVSKVRPYILPSFAYKLGDSECLPPQQIVGDEIVRSL